MNGAIGQGGVGQGLFGTAPGLQRETKIPQPTQQVREAIERFTAHLLGEEREIPSDYPAPYYRGLIRLPELVEKWDKSEIKEVVEALYAAISLNDLMDALGRRGVRIQPDELLRIIYDRSLALGDADVVPLERALRELREKGYEVFVSVLAQALLAREELGAYRGNLPYPEMSFRYTTLLPRLRSFAGILEDLFSRENQTEARAGTHRLSQAL